VLELTSDKDEQPLFVVGHRSDKRALTKVVVFLGACVAGLLVASELLLRIDSAAYAAADDIQNLSFLALVCLVALLVLLLALFNERRYEFYKDHFVISHADASNNSIPYTEVETVQFIPADKSGRPSNWPYQSLLASNNPRIVITAYSQHEQVPFEVFANPCNRDLGIRLADWLDQKISTLNTPTKQTPE